MINNAYDFSKLSESFQSLIGNKELTFQICDIFPLPIEIFAPDGTSVYINRAMMEMTGIKDASLIVGHYNLLHDPECIKLLGQENLQRAFRGECVAFSDFSTPIQDLMDRAVIEEKPYETGYVDAYLFPTWNGDQLTHVICVFVVKSMYQGRPDVATAKEYINSHWMDDFDPNAVAKSVNVSLAHLRALFKQHAGMTMHDYYKKVKVDHIKEKLADRSLSIAEAFSFCGEGSRGSYIRIFKELTGLTPTQYRDSLK